jgi:hypothetical protein
VPMPLAFPRHCPWPFLAPRRLRHSPLYPKYMLGDAVSMPMVPRLTANAGGWPLPGQERQSCARALFLALAREALVFLRFSLPPDEESFLLLSRP